MSVRRKARETALQTLYRLDIAEEAETEAGGDEVDGLAPGTEARRYCEALIGGIKARRAELDSTIESSSDNWTIDRMAVVDRNVLRIAAYELLYCPDTPPKAVIDEAIELAKKYGSDESGAFINGILDRVLKVKIRGA